MVGASVVAGAAVVVGASVVAVPSAVVAVPPFPQAATNRMVAISAGNLRDVLIRCSSPSLTYRTRAPDLRLTSNRRSKGERSVTLPPPLSECIRVPEYECTTHLSRNH